MSVSKRLLAALLCLCLLISLSSVSALADGEEFKIVALGDSTANGFNLDDYGYFSDYGSFEMQGFPYDHSYDALGFLELGSQKAYPALLRDYIREQMPDTKVSLTNLAIRGLRSDEIRYILDPGFELDKFGQAEMNEIEWAFRKCFHIDDISAFYTKELISADLITLDCCMNNFSEYMLSRLSAVMNNDPAALALFEDDHSSDLIGSLDPKLAAKISSYAEGFAAAFGQTISESTAEKLVDTVLYCYCDFCINFNAIVNTIRHLNDDVRIIVGGTYNPIKGVTAVLNGVSIDVGSLVDTLLRLVDLYMTGFDSNRYGYSFADLNSGIETGISIMQAASNSSELPTVLFKRMVTSIFHVSQMKLINDMNEKIVSEAEKKGIVSSDWGIIDDNAVFDAYDDVRRNGDGASEKSKVIYDVTERFIDILLFGSKCTELNITALLDALKGDTNKLVVQWMDTPINELSDGQKGVLYFTALANFAEAVGIHPSEKGCAQKFEIVKQAYLNNLPAADNSSVTVEEIHNNAVIAGINSITQSVLNAIFGIFEGFSDSLSELFAYIRNGLYDFVVSLSF